MSLKLCKGMFPGHFISHTDAHMSTISPGLGSRESRSATRFSSDLTEIPSGAPAAQRCWCFFPCTLASERKGAVVAPDTPQDYGPHSVQASCSPPGVHSSCAGWTSSAQPQLLKQAGKKQCGALAPTQDVSPRAGRSSWGEVAGFPMS